MKKSMLIELLSSLSRKEITEFSEYVRSPFFNKNQSLIKLCSYLKLQHPDFGKEAIEKKKVFSIIFPGIKYNDGFMRTLIFGLANLTEDYLSFNRYKKSYFKDKSFLLYELNDRQLNRTLEKNIKNISKNLEKETVKDNEYYYDKYNLENEKYLYYFRTKPDVYEKIIKKTRLKEMTEYMTIYYYTSVIGDYIRLFNLKNIYDLEFDFSGIQNIPDISKSPVLSKVPCLLISYYELMLFVKSDDISVLYKIKELLSEYEKNLDKDHLYNIYINLINFCSRKINSGNTELESEVLNLYKTGIEKNILPYHGIAHFRFYTTVTETAIKAGQLDWAVNFINKYRSWLPEEIRENTYNYAKSLFDFAAGNFTDSLERLSIVKYNDVYHKLKCKCLTAMLFYELGYTVQLLSHIDAFNHFIINDKLLNRERKKTYSLFIKYLKKIDSIRLFFNQSAYEKLGKKLTEERSVYNKNWLLRKLSELKH